MAIRWNYLRIDVIFPDYVQANDDCEMQKESGIKFPIFDEGLPPATMGC
jgi:hypothetical protein